MLCYTVYMLFYKISTRWKHLKGFGLVPIDTACWVSSWEVIETQYSKGSSRRPPSMHCLFSFTLVIYFYYFGLCLLLLLVPLDINPVLFVLDLYMKYTVEMVPLWTYIAWFVITPYVRSVGHVFAYLYTLDEDSEHTQGFFCDLISKIGKSFEYSKISNQSILEKITHIKITVKII